MINKYTLSSLNEVEFKGLYKSIDLVFKNNHVTSVEMISGNQILINSENVKLYVELNFGVFAGANNYKTKFARCVVWEEKKLVLDKIIAYLIRTGLSGGHPVEIVKSEAYLYMIENQVISYTEEDLWDNADDYLFEDGIDFKTPIAIYDMRDYSLKIKNKELWDLYLLKNDCLRRGKNVFLKYTTDYEKVVKVLCELISRNPSRYLKEK